MYDNLALRIEAYKDDSSELPAIWTPEYVGARMVEAFEVLAKVPERVGPSGMANSWPAILHEFHELIGVPVETKKAVVRVSAAELSRMNEAFSWAIAFLSDMPLQADALNLWAFCKAGDRAVADLLRKRVKKATKLAKRMTIDENKRRAQKTSHIASNVATWANSHIFQSNGDPEQIAKIKANAHIRFERAVRENNCLAIKYGFRDAAQGKILTRKSLDKYRHLGMAEIALKLHERGVLVR